jgi:cell division protein FtsL
MKLLKIEKKLYTMGFIAFICVMVLNAFGSAINGSTSIEISKLNREIKLQERKNESITMKVNELTSFDRVKVVIEEMGLSYNNENIIIINK